MGVIVGEARGTTLEGSRPRPWRQCPAQSLSASRPAA